MTKLGIPLTCYNLFMNSSINWILIYLGLTAVLLELFIGIEAGFDLVLIGIALMLGGWVGNMTDSWVIGVITATVITILYTLFGRQFIKQKLKVQTKSTNIESLIGKRGVVTREIGPHKAGQIRVGTEVWRAISDKNIPINAEVSIDKISGVSAHVVEYSHNIEHVTHNK